MTYVSNVTPTIIGQTHFLFATGKTGQLLIKGTPTTPLINGNETSTWSNDVHEFIKLHNAGLK
jgi:hypothetical protein